MADLYEVTVILKEDGKISDIEKIVSENAESKKTSDLKVRQFAYPIGKLTSGHYFAVEFICEPQVILEIEKELKAEKSIIRYLVTKALRHGPELVKQAEPAQKAEEEQIDETAEETTPQSLTEEVIESAQESSKKEAQTKEEIVEEKPRESEEKQPEEKPKAKKPEVVKEKPAEKLISKAPAKKAAKPAKAEKMSAEELDKKLEELVKE